MPMPNDGGRDLAPYRNPTTGKFDFQWDDTGNPTFDDSDSYTVLSDVLEHKEGYWADPSGQYGSTLYQIKLDKTSTRTDMISALDDCMKRPVSLRLIRAVVAVDVERRSPGKYALSLQYQNRDGHIQMTRLPIGS